MSKAKVVFLISKEADLDPKSSIIKLKSIKYESSNEVFIFDEDDQPKTYHKKLFETPCMISATKALDRRGKTRTVRMTLEGDLYELYIDKEKNFIFNEMILEEQGTSPPPPILSQSNPPPQNLSISLESISRNIVLDKFENKNQNASLWLKMFTNECQRIHVPIDRYFEVLRLFLTGTPLHWYEALYKSSITNWDTYVESFTNTFGQSSWSDLSFAYSFRWISGPYLDYALKKRALLLEVDNSLSVQSQINLIVVGLPRFLFDKIDRNEIESIDQLMSKLRQFNFQNRLIGNKLHNQNKQLEIKPHTYSKQTLDKNKQIHFNTSQTQQSEN